MNIKQNYSLLRHNTFGIDACCDRFLEYASKEEAVETAHMIASDNMPLLIIGGGSNLLLTGDYHGTVVHSAMQGITATVNDDGSVRVVAASGETFDDVVAYCVAHGWYGAENLSLIPGDVGASAVQNIGAYGVEAKDLIESVEAVEIATGSIVSIPSCECGYGYRQSRFKNEWKNKYLITEVTFILRSHGTLNLDYGNIRHELERREISNPTLAELRQLIIDIRRAKLPDPLVLGNAGSFFMNPVVEKEKYLQLAAQYPQMPHYPVDESHEKIPAGWLIDQCGWKGRSLGRAGVYERQALVLVNLGGATGADIVTLCEAVRHDVMRKFNIDIKTEVNII